MSFGTAHGHFTLSTKQTVQSTYISPYFPIQSGSNQIPIFSNVFFCLSAKNFFWFNPAVTIVGRPCYNSLGRDLAQRCRYNKHKPCWDFDGGELHNN
jgi:hypothetical protein